MAKGHENLIPASERSREEARENGRKGGRASGQARRRKKALRALLKEAVQMPLKDLPADMRSAIMAAARLSDDSLTIGEALIGALICASCGGDARMMKLLLDTLGEGVRRRLESVANRHHAPRVEFLRCFRLKRDGRTPPLQG